MLKLLKKLILYIFEYKELNNETSFKNERFETYEKELIYYGISSVHLG